jgi:hypothetical protein
MPGLPWVRLDANIASHDKIVALIASGPTGYRAVTVYLFALAWSGGQGQDGHVPKAVLPLLHGTGAIADLLVKHELWDVQGTEGWAIRNFAERQELAATTAAKREQARRAAHRRWHPNDPD